MTDEDPRSMAGVVAGNLRRTRTVRGLSTRALAERLASLGVTFPPSSLAKTEADDPAKRRRVDVDELAALSVALDTSPAFLLAPDDEDDVEVTPAVPARAEDVAAWARGERELWTGEDVDGQHERRRGDFYAVAPAPMRRRERIGAHPLVVSVLALETLVRDALDPDGAREHLEPAALAEGLRRQVARVRQYVDLLADELEHGRREQS